MKLKKHFDSLRSDLIAVARFHRIDLSIPAGKTGLETLFQVLTVVNRNRAYSDEHPGFTSKTWTRILPFDGRDYCWLYEDGANDSHVHSLLKAILKSLSPKDFQPEHSHTPPSTSMLKDPHVEIRRIEADIRAFRRDFTEAPRFIRQYLGLDCALKIEDIESDAEEVEDLKETVQVLETTRDELKAQFLSFAVAIRDTVAQVLLDPDDLQTCSPGNIIYALREILEDQDYVGEISHKLPDLPLRSSKSIGLDIDNPEDLLEKIRHLLPERSDTPAPEPAVATWQPGQPMTRDTLFPKASETQPAPKARKEKAPKAEVPPATRPPVMTRNEDKNGIELRFDGKPSAEDLAAMKSHGFRWRPRQPGKPWCARYSEERLVFALQISGQALPPVEPPAPPAPEPERSATPIPQASAGMPDFF